MPKGFDGAKKVGEYNNKSLHPRPVGVRYFQLKDGESAVVRFLTQHNDVDWVRKWKIGEWPNQELVNCVDQLEDGTPDPGYAKNLKSTFKAYPTMIWRKAVQWQKDKDGKYVSDTNKNRIITGYADTVAVWECSFRVYSMLNKLDAKFNGLMAQDFEITRSGSSTNTEYLILPDGPQSPITQEDQQLAMSNRIDVAGFVKVPTFTELENYLNGGTTPDPSFTEQAENNQTSADQNNPFV